MTRYNTMADLQRNISPDVQIVEPDYAAPSRTPEHMALLNAGALGSAQVEARSEHDEQAALFALKFEQLWRAWNGPELTKEYRFHSIRKWRLDYYHAQTKTGIELEGGLYSAGRHTRAKGYQADIEKYNAAAMLGITILRLGTGQVDHQHVTEIIDYVRRKMVAFEGE